MAERTLPPIALGNPSTFYDEKPSTNGIDRRREIRQHQSHRQLEGLLPFAQSSFQSVLQIGPGIGGETRAIQKLMPEASILGVDFDPDPLVQQSAAENGIAFMQADVLELQTSDLADLLERNHVDTIVALRSPAAVLSHLLQSLPSSFNGSFIFSLWAGPDFHHFGTLAEYVNNFGGKALKIEEGEYGMPNEVGYVLNFPLVEVEEVA